MARFPFQVIGEDGAVIPAATWILRSPGTWQWQPLEFEGAKSPAALDLSKGVLPHSVADPAIGHDDRPAHADRGPARAAVNSIAFPGLGAKCRVLFHLAESCESSRSDGMTVAVGFNPRIEECHQPFRRVATIENVQVSLRDTVFFAGLQVRGLKPTATIGGRYATKCAYLHAALHPLQS